MSEIIAIKYSYTVRCERYVKVPDHGAFEAIDREAFVASLAYDGHRFEFADGYYDSPQFIVATGEIQELTWDLT